MAVGVRHARIACACAVCDKPFTAQPSKIKTGRGVYCSIPCMRNRSVSVVPTAGRLMREPVRSSPAGTTTYPTLHASDPTVRTPERCPHCGSRLICVDRPTGLRGVGTIGCGLCSRQLYWLEP